jgi:hypothetical protein
MFLREAVEERRRGSRAAATVDIDFQGHL